MFLAVLNENNICEAIKMVKIFIDDEKHIEISNMSEDYLYRKYENGVWSEQKFIPNYAQIELDRLEELEQAVAFILGGGK